MLKYEIQRLVESSGTLLKKIKDSGSTVDHTDRSPENGPLIADAQCYRIIHEHLAIVSNFFGDFLAYVEHENREIDDYQKLLKSSQRSIHSCESECDGGLREDTLGITENSCFLQNLLE